MAELDKKEHKNWVMVGCALNITKKGITSKIQNKMETWYQSLISSPPLQSLPSCACAPSAPKCATCVTWEMELKRHHKSGRPKICWDNSDRTQWGSPTGAWEIAKVFIPTLGSRKKHVVDAETTDIGGLLNLLEWCPFINPSTSRTVLTSARDECRNHWAHAPKQEIQDADLSTIFGHLNNLLNDPVFSTDKDALQSLKDLQDLFHKGMVNVRESEIEALYLLRHSLVDEVSDVQSNILKVDAEMKKIKMVMHSDLSDVKEKGDLNREEISKLAQQLGELKDVMAHYSNDLSTVLKAVDDFNRFLNKRDDLQKVFEAIQDDLEVVKTKLSVTQSKVANTETSLASLQDKVIEVQKVAMETSTEVSILQEKVDVLEKGQATQEQNDSDDDALCTAPSRLPHFTGRKSALDWLEKSLLSESVEANPGTSCCTKTICGLGGCGKTSLAVEFAWSHKNHFRGGVFWINGESDENINKSVAEILSLTNIPSSTNDSIDDTLNKFLAWLSKKDLPWLLVMDNVDELQDAMCPVGVKKICKGPWQRTGKSLKNGHILLTTRQNANHARAFLMHSIDDFLELPCFNEEDGALFLMKRTDRKEESLDPGAISLAKELGALPLALEQAAAYITACPPLTFTEYLEKYQTVKVRLLQPQPVTALSMEAEHRLSVNSTWVMNFEYVKQRSPAAATMMQVAAFLESENIPIDVINPGYPELEQKELRDCARLKYDIADLLKTLSCHSLFSVDHHVNVFGVHKLVQEVVRDSLTTKQRVETLVAATRLLCSALEVKTSGTCENIFKHDTLPNLSGLKEEERRLVIALILNVRTLKNHIQGEIDSSDPDDNLTHFLCSDDLFCLCRFARSLILNNVFFNRINSELCDFQLKIVKIRGNQDPDSLLKLMVDASISKRNVPTREMFEEAKKQAQQSARELAEFETSGFVIDADVKYEVLEHMASYYAFEGEWERNYRELLKLESLSISNEKIVDLQICIARAENYVSAGNFQCVLDRYLKALELARKIYPPDHKELVRVLQFVSRHFFIDGKLVQGRDYAEELLHIAKKQPQQSDYYIRGITSALSTISYFDPQGAEDTLRGILVDRWPGMYDYLQSKEFDERMNDSHLLVDESSCAHAVLVLLELLKCFRDYKYEFKERDRTFYRNIAEMIVLLRKKMYHVDSHPEVKEAYTSLVMVLKSLGHQKEAQKIEERVRQCNEEPVFNRFFARTRCNWKVVEARKSKENADSFFKSRNYSKALELYTEALQCFPNDAKVLTDRVATYVKLSEQECSVQTKRELIECACEDANKAIAIDPSWVKGYYWKAICLAKLGHRGPSLAAAAVASYLFPSQCSGIPAVVEHFGPYIINVIATVDDLLQIVKREAGRNLVSLLKEGKYELTKPLEVPANAVMVGVGKVQIVCTKGVLLRLDETVHTENIEL